MRYRYLSLESIDLGEWGGFGPVVGLSRQGVGTKANPDYNRHDLCPGPNTRHKDLRRLRIVDDETSGYKSIAVGEHSGQL